MDYNMISDIIIQIGVFVINIIKTFGYTGIFFLMFLESAAVPIPSEIIMPFSGSLILKGIFNFWFVIIFGTLGNLFGSVFLYYIGKSGGRPLIERYGKFLFITKKHLESSDKWFLNYGDFAIFFGRLMPIIRTFISLPAGIAKTDIKKFFFYTFMGCLPWSIFLTYIGLKLGENWQIIEKYFRKFDIIILIIIIITIFFLTIKKIKNKNLNSNKY